MAFLKFQSTGPAVKDLQRKLKAAGFSAGGIDGKFGKQTERAVMDFQKKNKLTVDGKVGPKTMKALNSAFKAEPPKVKPDAPVEIVGGELNQRSLDNLAQCDPKLQRIAHEVAKRIKIIVICGHRGEKAQNKAFADGTSKLRWPNSKHNSKPSKAFDAVPYVKGAPGGIDWDDEAAFKRMRAVYKAVAAELGIKVRFISWDLPHIELA